MHGLADEFRRLNDQVELPPLRLVRELAALEERAVATLPAPDREAYGVRKLAALERVAREGRPSRGFLPHSAPFAAERAVNLAEGAALALRVQRFLADGAGESTIERLLGAVDLLWEVDSYDEERRLRGQTPDPPPLDAVAAERARLLTRLAEDARGADGPVLAAEVLRACRMRVEAMQLERDERSHFERAAACRRTAELLHALRAALAPALQPRPRKELGRLHRRCAGMAQDARLEIRLERLLGRRGAALLGWLGIWLLLLLLLLLVLDLFVTVPTSWILPLVGVDTAICTFLMGEFGLKLALVPDRTRWFLRHALTDLLPALPIALLLLIAERGKPEGDEELQRILLALQLSAFMRYLLLAGPFLRFLRFVASALRWLDELVDKMATVLNQDFIAFERTQAAAHAPAAALAVPAVLRKVARRQRLALEDAPGEERAQFLAEEADRLAGFFRERIAVGRPTDGTVRSAEFRLRSDPDRAEQRVEVERAIEVLWRVEPHEVEDHIGRRALLALARFLGVLGAPLIRHLPLIRPFAQAARRPEPEERVVAAARVAAAWLERWHARALAFADLSGILTAPQLLDRVASAVMKATQRPAVRLLLFGTLFVLFRGLFETVLGVSLGGFGRAIGNFVTRPLLVIGSFCLVILLTARWLKKVAGEASESLQRTADAQFLELVKLRKAAAADADLSLLARRVFVPEAAVRGGSAPVLDEAHLTQALEELVRVRQGRGPAHGPDVMDDGLRRDLEHAALLYLHYLDGPIFHRGDVKMSVQLLSNLNLERIRSERLLFDKAARKRLKKLDLEEGTLFSGPYLWFQFMAESVALEVARLLTEYNRCCLTRAERQSATPAEAAAFAEWLRRRQEIEGGRLRRPGDPRSLGQGSDRLVTTEFTALDFLAIDPERERRIEEVFGPEVLRILRDDRRRLVREVFGTRPLHLLPAERRTFNPYVFYRNHLAGGRALLLPVWWLSLWGRGLVLLVRRVVQTTREILFPELAKAPEADHRADFAVAVRKINRMRKPLFMECLRMRARFDLAYGGLPVPAASPKGMKGRSFLVQDLEFIGADPRERAPLLAEVEAARKELQGFHQWLLAEGQTLLPSVPAPDPRETERRRALCTAWVSDAWSIRTLACARARLAEIEAQLLGPGGRVVIPPLRRFVLLLQAGWRLVRRKPLKAEAAFQAFLRDAFAGRTLPFALRRRLLAAFRMDRLGLRRLALAWHGALDQGGLEAALRQRIGRVWLHPEQITRELVALRTVQTLSVLDVQAYRRLVFELGGFGADEAAQPA